MASVMDARVVLVGMRPAVTMTLVDMGMTLPGIDTAINIEAGLYKLGYELRATRQDVQTAREPALLETGDAEG